ncbi:radical SAM/SPASM domain-containing protein [Paramuribaculum intestinale]|uniref:radical SAM/SPASM domain-containing protein n=1 Tax=Paramuribaculum intestinale TaxID=2094151 RepID=UPI0025B24E82|nr:radical SAM protein [Paramuribaculum intestinale]
MAENRFSRFNHLFSRENVNLLYNSLSNAFVALDKESFDLLSKLHAGDDTSTLPEDIKGMLLKIKGIADDEFEVNKIKYVTRSTRFDHSHLALTINPTLVCNFACPYCFEYDHNGKTMTTETEDRIVDFVKSHSEAKSMRITWFGGEPLIAFDRIESLSKKLMSLDLEYDAGIISNGYLVNEDVAKRISHLHITSMQITLDGLKERHDSRRCLKNGGATFDRIISSMKLLREFAPDMRIGIRVNIDHENDQEFITLYKFITEEFDGKVSVFPAFTGDSTEKGTCNLYNRNEIREFAIKMFNEHGLVFDSFYPQSFRMECAIRKRATYVIGPEGELYGCWNDVGNPSRVYGNISENLTNESLFISYKTKADPLEDPNCLQCLLFPACNGGCPYERIKRLERGDPPADCPLIKDNIDSHLWNHYLCRQKPIPNP